jgi:ABC-type thiamin/hydroxymethylpyrimidine transport system permease subunit
MAYGLLKGKGWAWSITIILSFIGIVFGVISIATGNIGAIFHTIVNAVVLYYLYKPHVKMFFGKTKQKAAMTP